MMHVRMFRRLVGIGLVLAVLLAGCKPPELPPAPEMIETVTPDAAIIPPIATVAVAATELPSATAVPTGTPTATGTNTPTATPTMTPTLPLEPLWGVHLNRPSRDVSHAVQAGVYWTRYDKFNWDKIQPWADPPESYYWVSVDEQGLAAILDNGLNPIGIVTFTPGWAQKYPGAACGPVAEEALDEFAAFMNALVSRYSQPPLQVTYWEIGNEPDIARDYVDGHSGFGCWGEIGDQYYGGGYYAEMLKYVYPAVKQANPEAKLVVGGLMLDCDPVSPPETQPGSGEFRDCTSARFLEGVLANGGGDYFDAVSFHAYDYYIGILGGYANGNWHSTYLAPGPVLIAKTRYLRALLAAYGQQDKMLLNTELALLCGRTGKEPECTAVEFEQSKAYYMAQANAAAYQVGLGANIWYSLLGWRASGLIDRSRQPVPAHQALKFSADILSEVVPAGDIRTYPGVLGYRFSNPEREVWLVWSQDGMPHTIQLDTQPDQSYDVFGEVQDITGRKSEELEVTIAPQYLIFSK